MKSYIWLLLQWTHKANVISIASKAETDLEFRILFVCLQLRGRQCVK